ncbi:MAG: dienelactone hydrolase family protein [Anaerolineales bacterium]|nr:dienelactone hydrolase family protein [Anaerolineales bacterium]
MDRVYVMQLVRSFQVGELSRRNFLLRASAALGSVAAANLLLSACNANPNPTAPPVLEDAAQPTQAAPATTAATTEAAAAGTGANGSMAMVEYKDSDGETLMGYLARPQGDDPKPAIVVIQEWWGLNDHIKDVANRFANEGFVALAPDLYHGAVTTEPDEARKLVMELDMAEAVKEIQRGIDFLQEQSYVAGPKVGVIGFCMGGGLALQTALAEADLGAAVAFYGRPLSPDQAGQVKAPVLGLYGATDQGIPVADVEAMGNALKEAGVESEIQVYEGAGHAFFNDTAPSYNAEAAKDAWPRTLEWFRKHLSA